MREKQVIDAGVVDDLEALPEAADVYPNVNLQSVYVIGDDGKVKVELALARGKQSHDKRQDLARRDAEREVVRELGRRAKGMP